MNLRRFQQTPHSHQHVCPNCETKLSTEDDEKLICQNQDCEVEFCFCNGSANNATITPDEFVRCLSELLYSMNYTATEFDVENSLDAVLNNVRRLLDDTALSNETQHRCEENFEILSELSRALQRRDLSEVMQDSDGNRVEKLNGYYLWNDVLLYTVKSESNTTFVRVPTENATQVDPTDIEPLQYDLLDDIERRLREESSLAAK